MYGCYMEKCSGQLSGCLILVQPLCQMGNFVHRTSPVSVTVRTDAISHWSFISGVYVRGGKTKKEKNVMNALNWDLIL